MRSHDHDDPDGCIVNGPCDDDNDSDAYNDSNDEIKKTNPILITVTRAFVVIVVVVFP